MIKQALLKPMRDKSKQSSLWSESRDQKIKRRKKVMKLSRRVKTIKHCTGEGKLW